MKMTVRQCIMVQRTYRLMFRTRSKHYSHCTIARGKLFAST
jgi:hypothetical protein